MVDTVSVSSGYQSHHDIVPMSGNRWLFVKRTSLSELKEITWDGSTFTRTSIAGNFWIGSELDREWSRAVAQVNTIFMMSNDYFSVHEWEPSTSTMNTRFAFGGTSVDEREIVSAGTYFFTTDD